MSLVAGGVAWWAFGLGQFADSAHLNQVLNQIQPEQFSDGK